MKTIKILFLCMIASILVNAQNVPPYALTEVEVNPPKFTATVITEQTSTSSIGQYLAANFEHPEVIGLVREGTEVVQFTVNTSGKLEGIKVINSVSPQADEEVIRLLESTNHMWMPGRNNGVPVAMEQEIAIQVRTGENGVLADKKDFTKVAINYYEKGTQKLFVERKTNKALRHFETAIRYKPYDQCLLYMRAICNAELGHIETARQDMARINKLGGMEQSESYLSENIKTLEGYKALSAMLSDK